MPLTASTMTNRYGSRAQSSLLKSEGQNRHRNYFLSYANLEISIKITYMKPPIIVKFNIITQPET